MKARAGARRRAAVGLALTCCLCGCGCATGGPALGEHQIAARDVSLPAGAAAGSFIRWRCRGGSTVAEEMACVAGPSDTLTIERRVTQEGGACTVTAARYAADGRLLGVWRGPRGGVGRRLEVVAGGEPDEAMRKAAELADGHGVSAEAHSTMAREVLATPVGPLRCRRQTVRSSVLFFRGEMHTWWAEEPLPLSQMVRFEVDMPGWREVQELEACGFAGAEPALRVPAEAGDLPR